MINRKGQVEYVIVGDAKSVELPDFKRVRAGRERFRGLRCLHTHLRGEHLTQDDLTDLALLRLDLMAAVDVEKETGLPGVVRAAHLVPARSDNGNGAHSLEPIGTNGKGNGAYAHLDPAVPSQLDVDFLSLIESLEEEFARTAQQTSRQDQRDRAILISVTTGSMSEAEESMAELRELAESSDVVVMDSIIQRRPHLDPKFLIGKGKLDELVIRSMQLSADVIIFDQDLSPAQVRSINAATDLKIIDRSQLILDIFAQHAQSREGKIQVELAQLKYMLPRLTGAGTEMSRLMGGIGGRGPGETKLEVDRRRARDRIHLLEQQIEDLRKSRQNRRQQRSRRDVPIVSIVGYTNAGKSTLLNTLTASEVHAEQRMFATLDPTSRRLRLPREQEIVINDTVGFIRDLPKDLIAAFRATLEELESSDLLIHLVDISSPRLESHIRSVEDILAELGLSEIPRLTVFNKRDMVAPDEAENLCRIYDATAVSAIDARSLKPLLERVGEALERRLVAEAQ
ncbi:MAG TPA: GTPase HflX [Blastocatellia bacterium]|nr:GTPase HflX [Blastocatellia bacterium]